LLQDIEVERKASIGKQVKSNFSSQDIGERKNRGKKREATQ
jgi:hypothetical protein